MPKAWAGKISLIIPALNDAPHLAEFLAALARVRLLQPRELVIMNDDSADRPASCGKRAAVAVLPMAFRP